MSKIICLHARCALAWRSGVKLKQQAGVRAANAITIIRHGKKHRRICKMEALVSIAKLGLIGIALLMMAAVLALYFRVGLSIIY